MFRLVYSIVVHIFTCIRLAFLLKRSQKSSNRETRYAAVKTTTKNIVEKMHVTVKSSGLENIPGSGCFLMPNHQGRFDGLALIYTHESPMSIIVDNTRSDISFESDYMNLIDALRIDRENPRQSREVFQKATERVKKGDHICVFPEGKHEGNKNSLQEFKTGPFHFLKKNPLVIVPVCLFDTWKVFNYEKFSHALKRVTCQIHYLKPITPEEYSDLSKIELAELVKSRIQKKLEELSNVGCKESALNLC